MWPSCGHRVGIVRPSCGHRRVLHNYDMGAAPQPASLLPLPIASASMQPSQHAECGWEWGWCSGIDMWVLLQWHAARLLLHGICSPRRIMRSCERKNANISCTHPTWTRELRQLCWLCSKKTAHVTSTLLAPPLFNMTTLCSQESRTTDFHVLYTAVDEGSRQAQSCTAQTLQEGCSRLTKGRCILLLLTPHAPFNLLPQGIVTNVQLGRPLPLNCLHS